MSQDIELTNQRLGELWESTEIPVLEIRGNKHIIFSDVHLGNGGGADDFHANENTFLTALDYYKEKGYKLILLGDIEEFWQFKLSEIVGKYDGSICEKIRSFGDDKVYRVYGNHDLDWCRLIDPTKNTILEDTCAVEALKMKCGSDGTKIMLVHGHQGSTESDKDSWSSRFWVRVFRKVEPFAKKIGFTRHPSATKSRLAKDYEKIVYSWAKNNGVTIICGHSHRAIFSSKSYAERLKERIAKLQKEILENRTNKALIGRNRKEIKKLKEEYLKEKRRKLLIKSTETEGDPLPCYFNSGCALYSDGITGIEIADDEIKLAKWHRDPTLTPRYEIYEKENLSALISQLP